MSSNWLRRLGFCGLFVLTSAVAATAQVTFTKDVAPILQRSCQNCHRPGAIAPMSLLTYEDARPWARSIKQKVANARDAAVVHRPATSGSRSSRTIRR